MSGVLYLHGFCSSSGSAKGVFLAERFAKEDVMVLRPDLDGGRFTTTTLSKQLAVVERMVREHRPCMLIGSSLGGYLAALHAARWPDSVPALVLLAPAFDFAARLGAAVGPEEEAWGRTGARPFYHYAAQRELPLAYRFLEDARTYEAYPSVDMPTLVLHGQNDESVPASLSETFARERPNVDLELLDGDHGLLGVLDVLWDRIRSFHARWCQPHP